MPKIILTLAGTGLVASVNMASGASYTLNQNAALVSGALYEFEIHVPVGQSGISITGATLLWSETTPVED